MKLFFRISGIIFFLIGIFLLFTEIQGSITTGEKAGFTQTNGTVTKMENSYDAGTSKIIYSLPDISYTANNGQQYTSLATPIMHQSSYPNYYVGEKLQVYYRNNLPSNVLTTYQMNNFNE